MAVLPLPFPACCGHDSSFGILIPRSTPPPARMFEILPAGPAQPRPAAIAGWQATSNLPEDRPTPDRHRAL